MFAILFEALLIEIQEEIPQGGGVMSAKIVNKNFVNKLASPSLFQKSLEILDNLEILEILENRQTVENKRRVRPFLEFLENFENLSRPDPCSVDFRRETPEF